MKEKMIIIAHEATRERPRVISVHDSKRGIPLFDVYANNMVYWIEPESGLELLKKAQEILQNFEHFYRMAEVEEV